MQNRYINLNKIEFVVTDACTGRCRHCSQGEHIATGAHIPAQMAAEIVDKVCAYYPIKTVMTFGGEPLLFPDTVCAIHSKAREFAVERRQVITNGFFTKSIEDIEETARRLAKSGVNDILLSVDAFHQETIPLEPVKAFALAAMSNDIHIRTQPAWLVTKIHENPYNAKTRELIAEFSALGIAAAKGNVIFPEGNALKYLAEYFELGEEAQNPYFEDPFDIKTLSIDANGDVLGGNVFREDIRDIIVRYKPE